MVVVFQIWLLFLTFTLSAKRVFNTLPLAARGCGDLIGLEIRILCGFLVIYHPLSVFSTFLAFVIIFARTRFHRSGFLLSFWRPLRVILRRLCYHNVSTLPFIKPPILCFYLILSARLQT